MSVNAAIIGVGVALGVGCLLGAVAYWWQGVKARYDASPIGRIVDYDEDGATITFNERQLRRMMKQTSKEMDWTKARWQ